MSRPKTLTPEREEELVRRRRAGERSKILEHEFGLSATSIRRLAGPIHAKMSDAAKARERVAAAIKASKLAS